MPLLSMLQAGVPDRKKRRVAKDPPAVVAVARMEADRVEPSVWNSFPDLLRVPKWWFLDPVRASMRKLVRPCTQLTRRKQITLKFPLPARCFMEMMSVFQDGELEGLVHDGYGRPRPTRETAQVRYFSYIIRRASLVEKFFALEKFEKPLSGFKKRPWRRGLGSARLFLGAAAQRRGMQATVMAAVCGNVVIELREPRGFRSMLKLTIKMFMLSMDQHGNIIWPVDFDARSKAALRKQARSLLGRMIDDPNYPVGAAMSAALTNTATVDSRLQPAPRPPRPPQVPPANLE